MPTKDRSTPYDNLENLQEVAVFEELPRLVDQEQNRGRTFCTCQVCLVDIAAIALNSLPPRYVADRFNKFGDSETELARHKQEVVKAIHMAIHRVASRPHHR